MKKVLGFDSWTGGSSYYQRLLPALDARSIQLTLVHLGSWGNEPGCPRESRMGDLLVRDIAFYGGDSFERILDIERPDAVVLLSTDTFAHRAFIRYCRQRSIPTLNLYHGLLSVLDTEGEIGAPAVSPLAFARYVLSRAGKLLHHTLPCYAKALSKTKATPREWGAFLADIFRLAAGAKPWFGRAADDAKTSKCAVYVQADVDHAVRCYGFTRENVFVVGNPDCLQFGLKQNMIGRWSPPAKDIEKSIMYIECGFSSIGVVFSDTQGFVSHLVKTSKSLAAQGYKMRLKLKPNQTNSKFIEQSLVGTQIQLVTNETFLHSMMECSACIAETTSLAVLPTLVGMPLLLAKYDQLESLRFGTVLTSYPRSYPLEDISDVSEILREDAQISDRGKLSKWIDLNVGPLPPEKMPERVAAIVDDLIATASREEFA